jgi:type IX secretion system PorP/SprF family membrane protein
MNNTSFVPAWSGYNGNIESFLTYRQSWLGVAGAPKLGMFNINGALNDNMGLGFLLMTEKTGNFSQNYITATYAYHLYFSENTCLSAGISPLFFKNQINLSSIESYGTQLDPMLQNVDYLTVTAFDLGISLGFKTGDFSAGVSVPQTIGMTFRINDEGNNFALKRHYFGFLSYQANISKWQVTPTAIVRTTEQSPFNYGGSVMVKYKGRIWSNLGYNADNSILFSVGALSNNNIAISYSYEIGIGGLSRASMGSHEITLGFLIKPAKIFKHNATVFMPQQSFDVQTDDNLAQKVAVLDEQIKREQQQRKDKDTDLQQQIDSIKSVLGNTSAPANPTSTTHWLQRIVTQNITFGLMSDKIYSSSFSELDKYAKKLRQDADLKIKILVYTDNLFSEEVNKNMSQRRAKAIADYLLAKPGISAEQIEYEGMGSVDPIGDNTTPEGREKNNRVEILFSKKVF